MRRLSIYANLDRFYLSLISTGIKLPILQAIRDHNYAGTCKQAYNYHQLDDLSLNKTM